MIPTAKPPIPGATVNLRGEEFTVAPLTLDAYEKFWPQIKELREQKLEEVAACQLMREVVIEAVRENYPELDVPAFKKRLDVANLASTFQVALNETAKGSPPEKAIAP